MAWVIAAGIPNLNGIVSVVGGLFMINFTYSFPGMMYLGTKLCFFSRLYTYHPEAKLTLLLLFSIGWTIQKAAALPGEGFNPATRVTTRHDTGFKRWARGFKKSWKISAPTLLYVIAGLACCGMGTWAAIDGLIIQFGGGGTVATSFGCAVPV